MKPFAHPRVVVGVDDSLSALAAIRVAVAEARLRSLPLLAVRAGGTGITSLDSGAIVTAFLEALGAIPADVQVELHASVLPIRDALCTAACDPRDLIVVGTSGKGPWHAFWSGSVLHAVSRRARCAVLAVPAPEMARDARRSHHWRGRGRWDPLRDLEQARPEFHGRPYSGI
ncbi:MAG TPA: universal stress protein [Actinocrinis sp.]|nr:universal stress protein [Actinocrinis sp.]